MKNVLGIMFCMMLAFSSSAPAMGLRPKSEGQVAWEALQERVLGALGGKCAAVQQPARRVPALSAPAATGGEVALNQVVAASLQPMEAVKFVVGPEKMRGKPPDTGGLLVFTAPETGTYVLGTASRAWIDTVDQARNSLARAKHYEWVEFCGRRMKAGIFELRAGGRYWIQMSASPEPALDVFVAGPLN